MYTRAKVVINEIEPDITPEENERRFQDFVQAMKHVVLENAKAKERKRLRVRGRFTEGEAERSEE